MISLLPALLSSLDYLSYYGVDIPLQLGWLTLPTVGSTPSARNASYGDADAFFEGSNVSSLLQMPAAGLYERRVSGRPGSYSRLLPGWQANLSQWVDTQLAPRLANRTAAGVFVGDEICCHNATCEAADLLKDDGVKKTCRRRPDPGRSARRASSRRTGAASPAGCAARVPAMP